MPPDSKESQLGSSDQKAFRRLKYRGSFSAMLTWKCIPTAVPGGVNIFEVPRCHLLLQMSSL